MCITKTIFNISTPIIKSISFTVLILAITSSNLNSQNKKRVDSLLTVLEQQKDTVKINTYTQLFIEHINVDPEIAKTYLDAEMELAEAIKNKEFIARTKINYGVYLFNISKFEESIKVLEQLLIDFDELDNSYYKTVVLVNKGNALRELGYFEKALEDHIESLKIKEEINADKESIAISYWNIGNLQDDVGRTEDAIAYYKKSKTLFKELNSESDTIILNIMIAEDLSKIKKTQDAIPLYKDAVNFFKKHNAKQDLAKIYSYLGTSYIEYDSLDVSLDYFQKGLAINKEYSEEAYIGLDLRQIGKIYLEKNQPKKAIPYFTESLEISKKLNLKGEISKNYESLAKAKASVNNYKEAYTNLLEYKTISEEILNAENVERMNELEVKYKTEKKEKDLLLKENEIQLLEERKQKAESQRLFFIITALCILAFAIAVIYGLKQKMKRNKIEREKLDSDLEFKEKQLTTHALHLAHKNEVLLDLKEQLKSIKSESNNSRGFQNIINNINLDINNDNNWEQFKSYFEDVHKDFNTKIMSTYPEVSNNDLRLMSLLKMNLSSKEIANILNISTEGVKKARYRLRKKLNLSTEESLQELVISM
ncbi:tetratricopeptide repeat protein [uncultured Winogradskyella sp.]|uniref:tetratricopeptide repeat protein n=1 Tax=uncultured Winogradskyella sp. TaxID=395353 RepID=UPI00260424B8|nr:tetratricopeptide repeat protein [uncultured Winogradskyella sp.]